MANEEHLEILKQGPEVWNHWRKINSKIRPDLSEAILLRANLRGANLFRTNLEKANLSGGKVYGISAWDLTLAETIQKDLIITPLEVSSITVDDIEAA